MSLITRKEVEQVAQVARLSLTEDESEVFTEHLNLLLNLAKKMDEVDTTNVEPTTHLLDVHNVVRQDIARPSLAVEEVLKNAPEHADNQIKVPSIIGD